MKILACYSIPAAKLAAILLSAALSACASNALVPSPQDNQSIPDNTAQKAEEVVLPEATQEEFEEENTRVAVVTPEAISARAQQADNSAAASLREQAAEAMVAGDYARTDLLLARAMRIAPRDPANYYRLALLRLEQQQAEEALHFARKGLSLQPSEELHQQLKSVELSAEIANEDMIY